MKFLDDQKTYLGNQLESEFGEDRCFGILAGMGMGKVLHYFVITTVEVDATMFGRNINPVSFLYCGLLTIGFSMIVNLFMHQKLKKIDMVESLKSVE